MPLKDEVIKFSSEIEELVWAKDVSYMEAMVMYCEEKGLEIEVAAKLISPYIKAQIQNEAENLNFLPKNGKLPI